MTLYVVGRGVYCESVSEELPPLKQLVRECTGADVRRVGRFIQLALIGAGRAAHDLPVDTALFLSSGRGDMGAMVGVLEAICAEGRSPRPLNFINTVSNAACFYVAQALGLEAASSFISSRHFAFENTLVTAALDMCHHGVDSALVGVVDMVVDPPVEHVARLQQATGTTLAEASHWLHLVRDPGERPVHGTIEDMYDFPDAESFEDWVTGLDLYNTVFGAGQYLGAEASSWCERLELEMWSVPD
ncbi:MAG: hypothetical protein HKN19_15315, partial [Halioglobus sp.]|nr:hypothetical protein [Halioglobus sp.]